MLTNGVAQFRKQLNSKQMIGSMRNTNLRMLFPLYSSCTNINCCRYTKAGIDKFLHDVTPLRESSVKKKEEYQKMVGDLVVYDH